MNIAIADLQHIPVTFRGTASVPDAEIQELLTKLEEANDVLTEILEPFDNQSEHH